MSLIATTTCLLSLLAWPQQPPPQTPAPQQPDPTVVVAGRVVDLRGEGVPVAEVWFADPKNGDHKLLRTTTDAEGYFRLSRVPVAKSYKIWASSEDRTESFAFARGTNPTTTMELHDATTVNGQVLGADGKPVAKTIVTAAPAGRALSRRQIQATTDQDGRFELKRVPLGLSQVSAWVAGVGLAELHHRVVGKDNVQLAAEAQATTSFAITVDGLPKEGGPEFTLRWRPYRRGSYVELPPPFKRPIIHHGSWSCEGVPDWDYVISIGATGWTFQPDQVRAKAGKGPHQLGFVATRLAADDSAPPGIPCPAMVTDQNGKPVAGVDFAFRKSNSTLRATATSDQEGRLTFHSPVAVGTKVIVYSTSDAWVTDQVKTADMYGSHDRRFLEDHECVVDPNKTLKLRVIPATRVRGRLLRTDGQPAAYVTVQLEEDARNRLPRWMTFTRATTDRNGNYAFAGLHHSPEGVRVLVEGLHGAATSESFSLADIGGDVRLPDLLLTPPASVEGVVKDADGKPQPGVTIWLRDWDLNTGRQASGSVTEVITDKLGRYRFLGVPPGGAWLQLVKSEDDRNKAVVVEPFEVEPGKIYTFDIEGQ